MEEALTGAPHPVEAREIEIHYGPRATVGPVSFDVRRGSVLGLIGPNGSGKTSIMRAMCALQRLDAGEIRVFGRAVRAGLPVRDVGAMIEEPRFYPWLSASENLQLAAGGRRSWVDEIPGALERVGLSSLGRTPVAEFSQGMRQRLGVARALLGRPQLLVLDEPTNGLDAAGIKEMRTLMGTFAAAGTAIVLSSHLVSEIQAAADEVLVLVAGQAVVSDTMSQIVARSGSLSSMYERVLGV